MADLLVEMDRLRAELAEKEKLLCQYRSSFDFNRNDLLEYVSDAVIITDIHFTITSWNRAAERIYGWSASEVIGKDASIVLNGKFQIPPEEVLRQFRVDGFWQGEVIHFRKDDSPVHITSSVNLIKEESGKSPVIIHINRVVPDQSQVENMIQESERRWHFALEGAGDGVWDWDSLTGKVYYSRLWKAMLGYAESEISDQLSEWDSRLHPEDREKTHAELNKHLEGKTEIYTSEHRLRCKDGSYKWILDRGRVVSRTPDGKPWRVIGTHTDINDRKEAEERLRQSEENLRKAQQVAHIGSWKWHIQTDQLEWSDEMFRIFGIDQESFTGNLGDVMMRSIHPEDRPAVEESNLSVITHKKPIPVEYRVVRPDGKMRVVWAEAGELILDDAGSPAILTGLVQDITERKQVEVDLRTARDELNAIADNIPVMISHYKASGDYIYVNEPTARFFGKRKADFEGRNVRDIVLKASYDRAYPNIQRVLQGETVTFENTIPDGEGNMRFTQTHYTPHFDENGKVTGHFAMSQDITEQKAIEKALIEAEKLAGIGTLAAGMAHEINNPLQVITGTAESVQRRLKHTQDLTTEELERKLATISSNGWRIAAIVRSLLDYARSSTEEIQPHSLNEIIHSTLLIVEHQFKSWANITITTDLSPDLPTIICDGNKIAQVLINLLTNARDAMPSGGQITIQTRYNTPAMKVILQIMDTGGGIPEDIRSRIFDPFFTTKSPGSGTGLGLSIAAGIVRAHGGTLELENSSKDGSVFRISLPLTPITDKDANASSLGRF